MIKNIVITCGDRETVYGTVSKKLRHFLSRRMSYPSRRHKGLLSFPLDEFDYFKAQFLGHRPRRRIWNFTPADKPVQNALALVWPRFPVHPMDPGDGALIQTQGLPAKKRRRLLYWLRQAGRRKYQKLCNTKF